MMKQKTLLEIILVIFLTGVILHNVKAAVPCRLSDFKCFNGKCIKHAKFCDYSDDCGDNSDEKYCDVSKLLYYGGKHPCPSNWVYCPKGDQCIPEYFICDGIIDCQEQSEEFNCGKNLLNVPGTFVAKKELSAWLLQTRKTNSATSKWGPQVHRIAVALHLADESTFEPGNSTGDEIRYELTIQLLQQLRKDTKMNSHQLALYIHALLVACMDPRNFYEEDLVLELRRRVEEASNYINPFQMLVLCNAGDTMTSSDADRAVKAFESQLRPAWTDVQALAVMALACMANIDKRLEHRLVDIMKKLKEPSDFRTAALLTQAMFFDNFYRKTYFHNYNLNETIELLVNGLKKKSVIHAYYALPVFSKKSLLQINAKHCSKQRISEEEAIEKVLDVNGETIEVQYSVWIGDTKSLAQTFKVKIPVNSTIYDAIETIANIDSRQNVTYSLVKDKPYVTAVSEIEDDPEMETYWYVILRSSNSDEQPKIVKESPMDVKLQPDQEIILWYKTSSWND